MNQNKKQAFSGVMTRPADRVRRFSKSRGSSRVGSRGVRNITGRVGLGRDGSDRVGSDRIGLGRVGSGRVGSGRVGSGPVRRLSNITGQDDPGGGK